MRFLRLWRNSLMVGGASFLVLVGLPSSSVELGCLIALSTADSLFSISFQCALIYVQQVCLLYLHLNDVSWGHWKSIGFWNKHIQKSMQPKHTTNLPKSIGCYIVVNSPSIFLLGSERFYLNLTEISSLKITSVTITSAVGHKYKYKFYTLFYFKYIWTRKFIHTFNFIHREST